jgi:hypothetical protein
MVNHDSNATLTYRELCLYFESTLVITAQFVIRLQPITSKYVCSEEDDKKTELQDPIFSLFRQSLS